MIDILPFNLLRPLRWLLGSLLLVMLPLLGWGQVVISQVYGGGGNSGATYTNDFIELFNRGTTTVNLAGWTVQYAGSAGSFATSTTVTSNGNFTTLSGSIAPGQYYLIQEAGSTTSNLPAPNISGTINLSANPGKVALANNNTAVTGPTAVNVVDFVGYGTSAGVYEGTAAAPGPTGTTTAINSNAATRINSCTDTNQNGSDFTVLVANPRTNTVAQCNNAPTITNFTPTSGPIGTNVTIAGTSFLPDNKVAFNGTLATSVTYNSPVSLTAVVPVGTTTGTITVANGTATATSTDIFIVTAPAPSITVTSSLTAFNTTTGTFSASQSYTISGSNLTASIVVTAPSGYEVSQTSATGGFLSSQTVTQSGGNASATIYVRLAGTTTGTYSGNVTNASTGAATQNVAVSGTVVGKPTGTPTIAASALTFNSAVLTLGAADGTNLLVVVRPASSTATAPTDRTTYTASTTYGSGSALGAGFVVFAAANATSITVSGLAQSTAYAADIYTYNTGTTSGFENYGTTSATTTFTTPAQIGSPAGLLALEENFDYASGTLLAGNAATGWREADSGVNTIATAMGNLSSSTHQYPQGVLIAAQAGTSTEVSLATNGQDIYKQFTQPTGTTAIYMAALLTVNSAQTSGDYFLHFATLGSNFRGRVYVKAVSGSTTTFNFALGVFNESVAANYNTTPYNVGTTYLVVVKYENSAATGNIDAASLFVLDPTNVPVIEPTALITSTASSSSQTTLNAIGLRQGTATIAPTVTVDAIRVASGWGTVVGRPVYTSSTNTIVAGDYYSLRVAGTGTVATVSTTGPGNGVTAATAVILEKQLNLDGGQVAVPAATTAAPNPLLLRARNIINDGFDVLANGNTSYVNGPVSREVVGNSSPFFPVGRNGNYRPITLNISQAPSGTTIYTGVQTDASAYTADATLNTPLARVSRIRYFNITPNPVPATGTFAGTIVLSFGADDRVTDASLASFVVAKSNSAGWNNIGRSNNNGTTSGTLTSATFADFSNFSLASTDPDPTNNPLPVSLTSFTATRAAAGVQVAWATASEKNSAYFDVQRSLDGRTFASLAQVPAHGTTTQRHTYASLDATAPAALLYYRLRQVDLDGTVAYSPVVSVAADGTTSEFTLAPNPTRERLSFRTAQPTTYAVRNTLGLLVRSGTTTAGPNELLVDELPAGVYFFELHGDAGRLVRKFVKE